MTELVFILDRSGSMQGFEKDVIGGFNAMIEKQKQEDGEAYVSTFLFASKNELLHDRVPIAAVPLMTTEDYVAVGCTALLDTLGDAIDHIDTIHRYARPEDRPQKTLFLITTDGMENASHRYDSHTIKGLIRERTEEQGWEFIFLAANIDAVETAKQIGIDEDYAETFHQDSEGYIECFMMLDRAVSQARKEGSVQPLNKKGERKP